MSVASGYTRIMAATSDKDFITSGLGSLLYWLLLAWEAADQTNFMGVWNLKS